MIGLSLSDGNLAVSLILVQRIVFTLADRHKIRSEDTQPEAYDLSEVKYILRVVLGLELESPLSLTQA